MKMFARNIKIILLALLLVFTVPSQEASAESWWQEVLKKIIKAIDLAVQRVQNKTIALQNAQKVLENALSKLKLREIAEWSEKHRKLYQEYFDELWKVKNAIATLESVRKIIDRQASLVSEYQRAWATLKNDDHFSAWEVAYMFKVYSGILDKSILNLDALDLVIKSYDMQMSDEKRLKIIDKVSKNVERIFFALRQFSERNRSLSLSRARDASDLRNLRTLYNIQ